MTTDEQRFYAQENKEQSKQGFNILFLLCHRDLVLQIWNYGIEMIVKFVSVPVFLSHFLL